MSNFINFTSYISRANLTVMILIPPSLCLASIETFKNGFLDRTSTVRINHFKELPETIKRSYSNLTKTNTEESYQSFLKEAMSNLYSMGTVKLLIEESYKRGKITDLVRDLETRAYSYKVGKEPKWYVKLAHVYAYIFCTRNKIKINSLIPASDPTVSILAKDIPSKEVEARFVLSEVAAGINLRVSRGLLEDILAERDDDYKLHTIAGISYIFGFGPTYRYDNKGNLIKLPNSTIPVDLGKALEHARTAIKLNPKYAPAYYLAYISEVDADKRILYLRNYLAFETDKTKNTYKEAQKVLANE